MLVVVDVPAFVVFLAIQLALLGFRQVAVVRSHVLLFLPLNPILASLETRCLARRQFAVLDPVGNSILLAFFTVIDLVDPRMPRINHARAGAWSWSCGLSRGGRDTDQTANCQD